MTPDTTGAERFRYIGRGVYSLLDAHRLTKVGERAIRRWTKGYHYWHSGRRRFSPPIIHAEIDPELGYPVLSFVDLLEIRFLDAFLKHGVGWKAIRIAAERAQHLLDLDHPFSSRRFKTDGKHILAAIAEGSEDPILLNLVKNQFEFDRIVSPMLYDGIVFDEDHPSEWWPLGHDRRVVIDPARAFGAPIIAARSIPTEILVSAVQAAGDEDLVMGFYGVEREELRDAIEFESRFAA